MTRMCVNTCVCVGDLWRRDKDVRELFAKFGEVRDVYMPRDYYTKELRGFCYVKFALGKDAEDAVAAMDGKEIDGRKVQVTWAAGDRKSASDMRRKEYEIGGLGESWRGALSLGHASVSRGDNHYWSWW
jgi:FUS-interacting serine-arginine-rich protein 1